MNESQDATDLSSVLGGIEGSQVSPHFVQVGETTTTAADLLQINDVGALQQLLEETDRQLKELDTTAASKERFGVSSCPPDPDSHSRRLALAGMQENIGVRIRSLSA